MEPQIKETADGSPTLFSEHFQQYYHSIFGAKLESERVFLELGWAAARQKSQPIRLFEFGFGSGLNALLTWQQADIQGCVTHYTGLDAHPISAELAKKIHYGDETRLNSLHEAAWETWHWGSPTFRFRKIKQTWVDYQDTDSYDIIYFDAFPPSAQPELWTTDVFAKMATLLVPGGILTTYCAKGIVKRNLREAGFRVEKHAGPPRKREVIRAIKV